MEHSVAAQEKAQAIKWLKEHGYKKWPDGRSLEDVIRIATG